MPGPIRLNVVVLGVLTCGLAATHAQQPRPTFQATSDLVVIDLVAVDRGGQFVTDLRPDEIEVKEDGARQPVQLLRLVSATASTPGARGATPSTSTTAPSDAAPTSPGAAAPPDTRRLVIVVDLLSLTVDAVPRVRESLLATLATLPGDLPVLVATLGPDLRIVQPFTTDKAVLGRALASLPASLDPPAGVQRVFDTIDRMCATAVDQRRVVEAAVDAGEQVIADAQARAAIASETLALLVERLGALEGRKHLVFYSSGHALSPVTQAVDAIGVAVSACTGIDPMIVRREAASALGRLTTRAASDGLRTVTTRANRAQVTFYALDPAGVTTGTIMPSARGSAQTGGSGPTFALAGLRANAGRDYVESLAGETGGFTVTSNDMAVVLRRAWEDAGRYYLLGYRPPEAKGKGALRKITVSIKRSGVSVRYRKGYIDAATAPAIVTAPVSDAERAIDDALASPARFGNDAILVTPTVERDTLSIEVLVPHSAITFREESGRHDADFAVHAVLRDATKPDVTTDIPGKDIALRLSPDDYARITAAHTLRVVLTAPAPRRDARLIVVVRDAGGWIAARDLPCCAPAPVRGREVETHAADDLLARASTYVDGFVGRFSNVVMQESLTQTATAAPSTLGGRYSRVLTPGSTTTRQLRSDFLLVRPPSTAFWLAFRDVVEVDGQVVVDRQGRLEQLFLQGARSGLAEAQRIAAEGARFFLGARTRTTTSPVFALAFLQPHHQPRFRYRVESARGARAAATRVLVAEEVLEPTLLRTETGGNLPLKARYEIDAATGTIQVSEVSLSTMGESLVLRTRFAFDERTQAFVPAEMTEEHVMRSGARVATVARYGQARSFSVSTTEAVP